MNVREENESTEQAAIRWVDAGINGHWNEFIAFKIDDRLLYPINFSQWRQQCRLSLSH